MQKKVFPEPAPGRPASTLLKHAQAWMHARVARSKVFDWELFGEPAWDLLLELYQSYCLGTRTSISQLGLDTHIAQTTVLRWLDALEHKGLIMRWRDPNDGRRVFVVLTEPGLEKMERALSAAEAEDRKLGLGRLTLIE
jgi:DNA-binding MarR family transcriptional regulator